MLSYVLSYLEEIAIQQKQSGGTIKFSAIHLQFLGSVVSCFKSIVMIQQCPLDHKVIKFLVDLLELETNNSQ